MQPIKLKIIDDCQRKQTFKNKQIEEIFLKGRHSYIPIHEPEPIDPEQLLYSLPLTIPQSMRQNIDYIFILKDDTDIKKKLYDQIGTKFTSFEEFDKFLSNMKSPIIIEQSKSLKV